MRWAGFVMVIVIGGVSSVWLLRDQLDPGSAGIGLVLFSAFVVIPIVWSGASGTLAQRWVTWQRAWTLVGSHPIVVSVALLVVGVTGWVADGMVATVPVGPTVFLAGSIGFVSSLVDRRLPALLVTTVAAYAVLSVVGVGLSAREPVSVDKAIVMGLVLLATGVVALLISDSAYRWLMVAVGSVAAGYVWSGIAVVRFSPFSVPPRRVAIAGVLGAAIVALLLTFVARRLGSPSERLSETQR